MLAWTQHLVSSPRRAVAASGVLPSPHAQPRRDALAAPALSLRRWRAYPCAGAASRSAWPRRTAAPRSRTASSQVRGRLTSTHEAPNLPAVANYSLGIDIGGTFTDLVVYDHDAGRQW